MLFASILRLMPVDREKPRSQPVELTLEDLYRDHFDFVFRQASRIRRLFELGQSEEAKSDVPVRSLDRAEVLDAHRIAYAILDKLAPKKREAFILAEFEGLSCEEIAQLTDSRTETVWSRLHYARKEFADRLAARTRKDPAP